MTAETILSRPTVRTRFPPLYGTALPGPSDLLAVMKKLGLEVPSR